MRKEKGMTGERYDRQPNDLNAEKIRKGIPDGTRKTGRERSKERVKWPHAQGRQGELKRTCRVFGQRLIVQ